MTWSGETRAPLTEQRVYPPTDNGRLTTRVGVGGSPESVAGRTTRPAVDAGHHRRGARSALRPGSIFHRALSQFGRDRCLSAHTRRGTWRRPTSRPAREIWPHYAAMFGRIGRERGWPPVTRAQFDREVGPDGALCVGSPETVANKIAQTVRRVGSQPLRHESTATVRCRTRRWCEDHAARHWRWCRGRRRCWGGVRRVGGRTGKAGRAGG